MEKKVNVRADALKKVQEIVKRIETEKAELRAELEKTRAEMQAKEAGTTKASGFNVKDILYNDDNEVTEKLKVKIAKLENALSKPLYADAEFRKYSIAYLKVELEEYKEEKKVFDSTIHRMEHDLIVIPQQLLAVRADKTKALDEYYRKAINIGLSQEFGGMGLWGADYVLAQYEEMCAKYETN